MPTALSVPEMQQMAMCIAADAGISATLFLRLIAQESRWDPNIVNKRSGCTGLCQLHPRYFGGDGIDLTDPETNMRIAAKELCRLLTVHRGSYFDALVRYNHGAGKVNELRIAWGDDWAMHLPAETKAYIDIVLLGAEPKKAVATWRGR